jgi:PAS domain S-box-containing protein
LLNFNFDYHLRSMLVVLNGSSMKNDPIYSNQVSRQDILLRIESFFPDSVLLDSHFKILSISQNILEATGYTREELYGNSISCFSFGYDLKKQIAKKLTSFFFEEEEFEIWTKTGRIITYSISGFYLKMITDVDSTIVLKFKNLDELSVMQRKAESNGIDLDNFVYMSAHSLRGPLATMKGLINISKTCDNKEEMTFLLQQLDSFAENLDDKLHRLIRFAEADKGHESTVQDLTLKDVSESLTATILEGNLNHPIRFRCETYDQSIVLENVQVVLSLLRNLVLFFCHQPKEPDNQLTLDVHPKYNSTEIILRAKGFVLTNSIKERLKTTNVGYSEILNYPEMINFYAAKKIIFRLSGKIEFILTPLQEVVVFMIIP